ncbi:hypothetical protein N7528_004555 [Penicillium herquei]|nr:hypothetical protein N7528_004555 [Penicillium herquei]
MASQAAMLLDPKGFKKQMKKNGTSSLSESQDALQGDSEVVVNTMRGENPSSLSLDSAASSPAPDPVDSTESSHLLCLHAALPSTQPAAPAATSPTVHFSTTIPRKLSPSHADMTSSLAPADAPRPDDHVSVQFTDSKRSYHETHDVEDTARPRNFIEDIYDVEQRRQQPTKKIKIQETPTGSDSQRANIPGDSELGRFVKEDQKDTVVDLTATPPKDSTDDEIQVTGSNDLRSQRVCYGKVEGATVNAHLVPKPGENSRSIFPDQWPTVKMELRHMPDMKDNRIEVSDSHGKIFGFVEPRTAHALCPLLHSEHLPLDIAARLDPRPIFEDEVPWNPISQNYKASLILYGERQYAELIGRQLSQHNIWLGTPPFVEKGVPLWNPHEQKRRALAAASTAAAVNNGRDRLGQRYEVRTAEEITDSVTKMLNQLHNTDIPEMEAPSSILTPLLHHQKQALWFMTEKEKPRRFGRTEADNTSLWRVQRSNKKQTNGQTEYREIITGLVVPQEPPQVLGGLLADMMGLGKTLSILSLALSSLSQAYEWEKKPPPPGLSRIIPGVRNTRTTLLVVPLSAVKNWEMQIQEHLQENSVNYYTFHGPNRTFDLKELSTYDLIITTYHTILSEIQGRSGRGPSPLTKMNMFRIVLDEAHTIREQNAQQTKAILGLNANRRWSVTGTPVQNRLEDLLSVTRFLRLAPYDERSRFNQFIISRFKSGDPTALTSLQLFIDSFTLRRVKDRINLPPREDSLIMLDFSDEEKKLHNFFRAESSQMMKVLTNDTKSSIGGRVYHHVLKAMMILRQVSAHGKELLPLEDRERIKGLNRHEPIDLDDNTQDISGPPDEKKGYEMFTLMQETNADQCALCRKSFADAVNGTANGNGNGNGSGEVDRDTAMAVFLPCFDIICPECFLNQKNEWEATSETDIMCKACDGWITKAYTFLTPAGLDAYTIQQAQDRQLRRNGKILGEYEGPHTKTKALIEHLQASLEESEALVNEPPIKSVVFSQWTTHLDLIEIALKNSNLDTFTRLDGSMTLAARGKALEAFAKDDNITILLATIGAGGVGLNLTSGSRVYIMEPHYNPAAVAQAVDRVHRLGQKRPVRTIQFIMNDSIEKKILELAKKKQRLADMSLNRGKLDKKEAQEQRMAEYRTLFL